jgi:hypothetical protein
MRKLLFATAALLTALTGPVLAQNTAATGESVENGAAAPSDGVSPAVLREVREMALAADKAAATPEPEKSEEAIAAEKKAIERHRDGFFARIEERE